MFFYKIFSCLIYLCLKYSLYLRKKQIKKIKYSFGSIEYEDNKTKYKNNENQEIEEQEFIEKNKNNEDQNNFSLDRFTKVSHIINLKNHLGYEFQNKESYFLKIFPFNENYLDQKLSIIYRWHFYVKKLKPKYKETFLNKNFFRNKILVKIEEKIKKLLFFILIKIFQALDFFSVINFLIIFFYFFSYLFLRSTFNKKELLLFTFYFFFIFINMCDSILFLFHFNPAIFFYPFTNNFYFSKNEIQK